MSCKRRMSMVSRSVTLRLAVLMLLLTTDVPLLLSYYYSKLSLLLTVSRSRPGADQVMNAGLFESIRESGLFLVDPDLGLGKWWDIFS